MQESTRGDSPFKLKAPCSPLTTSMVEEAAFSNTHTHTHTLHLGPLPFTAEIIVLMIDMQCSVT